MTPEDKFLSHSGDLSTSWKVWVWSTKTCKVEEETICAMSFWQALEVLLRDKNVEPGHIKAIWSLKEQKERIFYDKLQKTNLKLKERMNDGTSE